MTQRHFFALPDDLFPVFEAVEGKTAVSYIGPGDHSKGTDHSLPLQRFLDESLPSSGSMTPGIRT